MTTKSIIFSFFLVSFFTGIFLGHSLLHIFLRDDLIENDMVLGEGVETDGQTPTPTFTPTPSPTPTSSSTPTWTPTPTLSPTPSPTPTPIIAPADLEPLFIRYANEYGIDNQLLKRIAYCESEFNTQAVSGPYVGLFQFATEQWITYRTQRGHDPNPDLRLNADESIKTAAYLVSLGKLFMWPNCLE